MKEHGARTMDELGRIVLPRTVREAINAVAGDAFSVTLDGNKIVLSPQSARCKLCDTQEGLVEINGYTICKECMAQIKNYASK